ncbi:putative secreted protein (Por secretion system target) [Maribacter spongiicola]|uniref:Putative secreted protein (Por secretion system target) n=1 Tax=Maribacter spongiicola TaxID=1206753 RepID=A0A4R7K606_9FLAO|nr:T9SS type A sorting domain-containing protein [Maribacter spongiicola]TDT46685.1 putative secreted protein (Por secretion system target) [Maribacter spongiicola]
MKRKLLLILFTFVVFITRSQEDAAIEIEKYEQKLDAIDKQSIKTNYLLNKGFMMSGFLDDFFAYENHDEDVFTEINPQKFKLLYKGMRKSDLNNRKRLPQFSFKNLKAQYADRPNVVPIGVIQTRGEYLDSLQIEDNIQKTRNNIAIDADYAKYFVFNAGVLSKKVYSGNITFEVVPELFQIQNPKSIKSTSIDFSDGNGFRPLDSLSNFKVRYESIGEKVVAVQFKQGKKTFTSYSRIMVVTLDDEEPDMVLFPETGEVQSSKAAISSGKTGTIGQSARSSSSTDGSATVHLGCDVVFDQPVIVIEGFDPINENSSANLRANYTTSGVERIFRANGYDMVYFNFQNGGADIIQNATVIRNLIEQVNREKVGNEKIIVIGESMGGIIARLAIRSLESSNITHNISHYISFDAPHKGANLPVGFQSLVRQIDDVNILPADIKEDLDDALERLDAKAARQLLIRFNGPNPHPDFTSLQNELNRVGFPQREGIRNIAMVNGAVDGSLGDTGFFNVPGSEIIEAQGAFAGLFTVGAEVVSNNLGGTTRVSTLVIRTGGIPTTDKRAFFNFNSINYDIASGGGVDIEREVDALNGFDVDIPNRFVTFVPLFSSLASTRSTTSQTELNRSEAYLRARGQVPFNRVFGNIVNSEHIDAARLFTPWNSLLSSELGLNTTTTCTQTPSATIRPPSPRINGTYFYTCQNSGGDVTLRVDNNPDFLGNLYSHSWSVSGPRSMSGTGDTFRMSSTLPAGVYTVAVTRSFSSATINDLPTASRNRVGTSSSSRAFSVLTTSSSICANGGGPGPGPGGGIPLTANLGDFEIEDVSEVGIWPNPSSDIINVSYIIDKKSEVSVSLIAINNVYNNVISLGTESREPGEYVDGFDVGHVAEGVYVLVVDINGVQTRKKIIIKKN